MDYKANYFTNFDAAMMRLALDEAKQASVCGEVPVGAVILCNGIVVAKSSNSVIQNCDPTSHAELLAIRRACHSLQRSRLNDCTLYVTLEPCTMCSGAIFGAQMARVIYAAAEPKTGASGSVINVYSNRHVNHHTQIHGGLLQEESVELLQEFFVNIRKKQQENRSTSQQKLRPDMIRSDSKNGMIFLPDGMQSHYKNDWPSAPGVRLHWLSGGFVGAVIPPFLLLHPIPLWSAWFTPYIESIFDQALIYALDRLGCGFSDKPKKFSIEWVSLEQQLLMDWIESLPISLFRLVASKKDQSTVTYVLEKYSHQCLEVLWLEDVISKKNTHYEWLQAPFPNEGHAAFALQLANKLNAELQKKTSTPGSNQKQKRLPSLLKTVKKMGLI
jgi:tRNA(Arg) A34 adenosine deaminase TadA